VSTLRLILSALVGAALLPLAACTDPVDTEDLVQSPLITPPMMNTRPATYNCEDSGRVVVRPLGEDGKVVVLAFVNRELQLKSVPADQGQKYSDGQTVFWMNGANATLLLAGKEEPESCEKPS
jgi:membrane-bound inhibitor of C-type lysozyme